MYAIQAPAFESALSYGVSRTASNPDEPPSRPLDIVAACKHKQEIVTNLPKNCGHCKAELQSDWVQEINDDIFAYCKGKDGCGKSQMLFVGPKDYISRTYEKVCVFKPKASPQQEAGEAAEGELEQPPMEERAISPPPFSEMAALPPSIPTMMETMAPPMSEMEAPVEHPPMAEIPLYIPSATPPMMETMATPFSEMMAAPPPISEMADPPMTEIPVQRRRRASLPRAPAAPAYDAKEVCENCQKAFSEHRQDHDQHGWVLVKTEQLQEPADWPIYQAPGVWKNRDQL